VTRTLLLADDSVTIQRVVELTFADEDVRVVAVGDGDQAIARLEERAPDIVLADVAMPGRNGYEVARYIKHSDRFAHIPVLLLTGAFEPVDQAKVAEIGCDGVLAKPFEPQFVIGRVKELLGMARPAAAPPAEPVERSVSTAPEPAPVQSAAPAAAAPVQPAPAAAPLEKDGPAAPDSISEYLDRLDNALANVPTNGGAVPQSRAPTAGPAAPVVLSRPAESAWDLGGDGEVQTMSVVGTAVRTPILLNPRPDGPALPALAEAFAALLAAEHGTPASPAGGWSSPGAAIGEDVVERIADRVLERLSDQVIREKVSELVSDLAERLIREEIERLKASIP
jgi:CheY-like chemotaxis protein